MSTQRCSRCGYRRINSDLYTCADCKGDFCNSCLSRTTSIYEPNLCTTCRAVRIERDAQKGRYKL